jgi:hypothetical protein
MVMIPAGFGTKTSKDQQKFATKKYSQQCNKHSTYTERLTPLLIDKESPLLYTYMSRREKKPSSSILIRPEDKNDQ